jgi:hypothetical protein
VLYICIQITKVFAKIPCLTQIDLHFEMMGNTNLFDTYLRSYAKTRASEVSETQKVNFVSTDIAIEFFEEGKKIGEQEFKKKLKESFEKRVKFQIDTTLEVVKQLGSVLNEKGYNAHKLFLSINTTTSKILITIPEAQHYTDAFMNLFYPLASDLEETHSSADFSLQLSAIDESEFLNIDLLKSDGYSFGYDLINETKLY